MPDRNHPAGDHARASMSQADDGARGAMALTEEGVIAHGYRGQC
jgi:hypothetical protein